MLNDLVRMMCVAAQAGRVGAPKWTCRELAAASFIPGNHIESRLLVAQPSVNASGAERNSLCP